MSWAVAAAACRRKTSLTSCRSFSVNSCVAAAWAERWAAPRITVAMSEARVFRLRCRFMEIVLYARIRYFLAARERDFLAACRGVMVSDTTLAKIRELLARGRVRDACLEPSFSALPTRLACRIPFQSLLAP